jgi:sec-independent protein translocase protein TatA
MAMNITEQTTNQLLAVFGLPGGAEWIVILLVALLLFGRRLPDVARSVGKSIVEFKRGLREVKSDIDVQSQMESSAPSQLKDQGAAPSAHATASPTDRTPAKPSDVPSDH